MGYLQCPHAPTILDKNGNLVDSYENVGWQWDRPELYLGQLEYISSFILELVTTIQEHDPDALIIVQSDTAPVRPTTSTTWASGIPLIRRWRTPICRTT